VTSPSDDDLKAAAKRLADYTADNLATELEKKFRRGRYVDARVTIHKLITTAYMAGAHAASEDSTE
jgi:hypothetical protein